MKYELVIPESRSIKYQSSNSSGVVTDLEHAGEYNGYPVLKGIFKGTERSRLLWATSTSEVEHVATLYGIKQRDLDAGLKVDHTCG